MKLAEFLADYIECKQEKQPRESGLIDLTSVVQAGIETFVEAKEMDIAINGFDKHGKFVQAESYRYER